MLLAASQLVMLQIFTVTHTHTLAKWEDVNSLRVAADISAKLITPKTQKKMDVLFSINIKSSKLEHHKKCQISIRVYISPIYGKLSAMQ